MYIQRHLENQIREASKFYPVVMVCGQRQVGKSTMLNHIKEPERRYVTLDDGNLGEFYDFLVFMAARTSMELKYSEIANAIGISAPTAKEWVSILERFFETCVVSEIVKSYYNAGKRPDLYYYRDIDGKEIDLLFVEGDRIYPAEIKKAKMPSHADRNFSVLRKLKMDVQPGVILYMADEMLPYSRDVWYFPAAGV
ncbi:MAG: DUF4143 domain-containing protein [Candidatus Gastranaerophilales bacterium]|nr:DUF4143 domain-containing protein [Candidatus Gastranaerophilales bacterium]